MISDDERIGLLIFTALALLPMIPVLFFGQRYLLRRNPPAKRPFLLSAGVALVVYLLVCADAFLLEPDMPRLNRLSIQGNVSAPLTILQLSDLHLEAYTPRRERWLFETLKTLRPDLILLTGDIQQMDMSNVEVLREKLGRLAAPLGVYGCSGHDNLAILREACPHITWLENRTVRLQRGPDLIGLAGFVAVGRRESIYDAMNDTAFRIVMHHTPGLAEEAAGHEADVYLCGHTHGGQVRIPFWGALVTNSPTGKRFERGLYRLGKTWIYTSSGLGLEPSPAPHVRFLCRPEITLITIQPLNAP